MPLHLVTGGCGFLGTLIVKRLLERGERVRILDVWEDPQRAGEAEFVQADVRDRPRVARALQGVSVVHHTAALVPLNKAGREFREVNVEGSRVVAEESGRAGAQSFVHMSSSAVFARHVRAPIQRDAPLSPAETYGESKAAGETLVAQICAQYSIPLYVVRPRTILGPGRLGIFKILFDWIREGRNVYVIGDGRIRFQFVHAHDLVDAYMLALDRGQPGFYNAGTDRFGTLREALEGLVSHAGTATKVKSLPKALTVSALRALDALGLSPLAPYHYLAYHQEYFFDVAPLLELGWRPKYSNDEMFRETYDWFLRHRESPMSEGAGGANRKSAHEKILWVLKKFS